MPASPAWLTDQPGRPAGCTCRPRPSPAGPTRAAWPHRRTLGGHRRFDPELIDALVEALTYRP